MLCIPLKLVVNTCILTQRKNCAYKKLCLTNTKKQENKQIQQKTKSKKMYTRIFNQ